MNLKQDLLLIGGSLLLFVTITSSQTPSLDAYNEVFSDELIEPSELKYTGDEYIHVGMILANLTLSEEKKFEDTKLGRKFKIFCKSLLYNSAGSKIHLVFLTDEQTKPHIKTTLINALGKIAFIGSIGTGSAIHSPQDILLPRWKYPRSIRVEFVDIGFFSRTYRKEIDIMIKYYGWTEPPRKKMMPDGFEYILWFDKYQKDLFYIAPYYPQAFPQSLEYIIMLDVDLDIRTDLSKLAAERSKMAESEIIGVGSETTPHYYMMTKIHRKLNPESKAGFAGVKTQGFNTGVVLYDLDKMRKSESFLSELNEERFLALNDEFQFKGSVGDQDLFTQMGWMKPELFYNLPCAFNFQTWENKFAESESTELYSEYHNCKQEAKIIHNNSDEII